ADGAPLLVGLHFRLALGVGSSVPHHLVAAFRVGRQQLRAIVVELAVEQHGVRQVVVVGELQKPPRADAVAVVAPGEAAHVGLRLRHRVVVAQAFAESEMLDVETEMHRETLAARPGVIGSFHNRRIVVAAVRAQHRISLGISRSGRLACGRRYTASPIRNHKWRMEVRSLTRCFVAALALALSPLAFAQAWPERPIRLIVNFAAGGSTDIIARSMATQLGEALGQPVVVENRVGAGGNIGLVAVARAAPDGYTLLHSSDGPILINPHIFRMEVDVARDLLPIAPTAGSALFLISRADLPARNMAEFIAYARANPGKLNYGSAGSGTLQHIAIE